MWTRKIWVGQDGSLVCSFFHSFTLTHSFTEPDVLTAARGLLPENGSDFCRSPAERGSGPRRPKPVAGRGWGEPGPGAVHAGRRAAGMQAEPHHRGLLL